MAGTKYAYVRNFELPDPLLPDTYLLCRLDGRSFHRFSEAHGFSKPNDERALKLMDHAAKTAMIEFKDIILAFGESDEFSFLFRKSTDLYNRRNAKILTALTSYFTSSYVLGWSQYFPDTPLRYPPSFDGRIVVYPTERAIRDYFSWRQADTHINNLYNTIFWALVQLGGQSTAEAHEMLKGTVSATKHEMLFSRFKINYNEIPARFRKGSVIVREIVEPQPAAPVPSAGSCATLTHQHDEIETRPESGPTSTPITHTIPQSTDLERDEIGPPSDPPRDRDIEARALSSKESKKKKKKKKKNKIKLETKTKTKIEIMHCDIIRDEFWLARPYLLDDRLW